MRLLIVLLFIACSLGACQSDTDRWLPASLNNEIQLEIKYALSRYWEKAPKRADAGTKFNPEFDEYYQQKSRQAILSKYYPGKGDTIYLEIQKRAPSLHDKWVGIGIKMVLEKNGLQYYEEVYRTWKFTNSELERKTATIFKDWVSGKSLSIYYPQNSTEEFIEFPDANNYFDSYSKQWRQHNAATTY